MGKLASNDMDKEIGIRIRIRRQALALSQKELGRSIGNISFQQVQKYENGLNKVSGSMFFRLARALDIPISYFFGEYDASLGLNDQKAMRMLEGFKKIHSEELRDAVSQVVEVISVIEKKVV